MEVGLGIAYQDSPPLYLMDGEHRIMISDASNDSDRLLLQQAGRKKIAPMPESSRCIRSRSEAEVIRKE